MRRWQKITAWSIGGLLALILLLVGTLLIVGNTDSGRDLIVRMTSRLTKGNVQIAGIHGSFPASLDLDRLQLTVTHLSPGGIMLHGPALAFRSCGPDRVPRNWAHAEQ